MAFSLVLGLLDLRNTVVEASAVRVNGSPCTRNARLYEAHGLAAGTLDVVIDFGRQSRYWTIERRLSVTQSGADRPAVAMVSPHPSFGEPIVSGGSGSWQIAVNITASRLKDVAREVAAATGDSSWDFPLDRAPQIPLLPGRPQPSTRAVSVFGSPIHTGSAPSPFCFRDRPDNKIAFVTSEPLPAPRGQLLRLQYTSEREAVFVWIPNGLEFRESDASFAEGRADTRSAVQFHVYLHPDYGRGRHHPNPQPFPFDVNFMQVARRYLLWGTAGFPAHRRLPAIVPSYDMYPVIDRALLSQHALADTQGERMKFAA